MGGISLNKFCFKYTWLNFFVFFIIVHLINVWDMEYIMALINCLLVRVSKLLGDYICVY